MRNIILIAFLAVAGFVGYQQWSAYGERQERERIAAEAAREAAEREAEAKKERASKKERDRTFPEGHHKHKITCTTCDGIGRVTVSMANGRQKLDTCPVCSFTGYRTIVMPPDAKLCRQCGGMGRLRQNQSTSQMRSRRCKLCSGMGYTVMRSKQ